MESLTTIPGRLGAVVLAAGASRRMGRPKALLEVDGETFLERWLRILRDTGVSEVRIVVAPSLELPDLPAAVETRLVVINRQPERGMLSSFQAGLRRLPAGVEGVFLCPVDHPLVAADLPGRMARALVPGGIVVPVCDGRRGHPVLFSRDTFPEILAAPLAEGARKVVRADPGRVVEVPADAGILTDVNTPQDYRDLTG